MNPLDIVKKHSRAKLSENWQSFVGFSLGQIIYAHRKFDNATVAIAKLHHSQRTYRLGGGVVIYGPSGTGKSTLLKNYFANYPTMREGNNVVIPVLLVTLPSSATAHGLLTAIFDALGYPNPNRLQLAEKTSKLIKLLAIYRVELILIDEFQHSFYSRKITDNRELVDTLKNVISLSKVACVLVGLPEAEDVVFSHVQIARRHSQRVEISSFSLDDKDDFVEFRAILKAYQDALPIQSEIPLHEANLARRMLIASDGILDYLSKLLSKSVEIAGMAGLTQLDISVFSVAFREVVWPHVPDKLNPFHPDSPLRRLNKTGEPFYPWHDKHPIGSPLARRIQTIHKGER